MWQNTVATICMILCLSQSTTRKETLKKLYEAVSLVSMRNCVKVTIISSDTTFAHSFKKDPEFQHEASGCTAVAGLLSKDNILYVVCITRHDLISFALCMGFVCVHLETCHG